MPLAVGSEGTGTSFQFRVDGQDSQGRAFNTAITYTLDATSSGTKFNNFYNLVMASNSDYTGEIRGNTEVLSLNEVASGDINRAIITQIRLNADSDYTGTLTDLTWLKIINNGLSIIL